MCAHIHTDNTLSADFCPRKEQVFLAIYLWLPWCICLPSVFLFFQDGFSLCSPRCPGTCSADQARLKFKRSTCFCLAHSGIRSISTSPNLLPSFYPIPFVYPADPPLAVLRCYLTLGTHRSPAWLGPPVGGGCSQPHLSVPLFW